MSNTKVKRHRPAAIVLNIQTLVGPIVINIDQSVQDLETFVRGKLERVIVEESAKNITGILQTLGVEREKFRSANQDISQKEEPRCVLNVCTFVESLDITYGKTTSCPDQQNVHSEQQATGENHQQN